jgi:hypothetical protein
LEDQEISRIGYSTLIFLAEANRVRHLRDSRCIYLQPDKREHRLKRRVTMLYGLFILFSPFICGFLNQRFDLILFSDDVAIGLYDIPSFGGTY